MGWRCLTFRVEPPHSCAQRVVPKVMLGLVRLSVITVTPPTDPWQELPCEFPPPGTFVCFPHCCTPSTRKAAGT